MTEGRAQGIIDALPEPAFLLDRDGGIVAANRAARAAFGPAAASGRIADRLATPPEELERYLERARMTTSTLPGALVFRSGDAETRFRVHCTRLPGSAPEVRLLLRCADPRADRFSVLAERVRQLDDELRRRVREKAVLREALDENRTLMRELQHRVKNNIQMMISLLTMSAANNGSDEVSRLVATAKDRFRALAATQDLIYEAHADSAVPAPLLFGRLAKAIEESTDAGLSIELDIEEVLLPQESAHCLALIVNELITNSIKHGSGETGTIRLELARSDGQLRLVVRDDGSGYPPLESLPRTSGLTLVRGLCRQIGASLELGNEDGAKSVVAIGEGHPTYSGDPKRAAAPTIPSFPA